MKHLLKYKLFEEQVMLKTLSNIEPIIIDDFLHIKIFNDIIYFITNDDVETYSSPYSFVSLITGVSKISDTKYADNPKIREIKIVDNLIPGGSAKGTLLKKLLRECGYTYKEIEKRYVEIKNDISLNTMIQNSSNIGELIDKYKTFKNEFFKSEFEIYDEWKAAFEIKRQESMRRREERERRRDNPEMFINKSQMEK